MTDLLTIGERIAALRMAKGLSQRELGEKIGRSRSSVAQIEAGGMKPDYEFIKGVVKVCEGSYEYIIEDPKESNVASPGAADIAATENPPVESKGVVFSKQIPEVRFKPQNARSGHIASQNQDEFADFTIMEKRSRQLPSSKKPQIEEVTITLPRSEFESLMELMIQIKSKLSKNESNAEPRHFEQSRKKQTLVLEPEFSEA